MALTPCPVDTDNISTVGTTPAERGLTTDQFKALFDKFGVDFVAWFNATHLAEAGVYSQQSTLRQAIINGNFSINQRAVAGAVTLAAGQYGHDRWKAGASGCTYTFATVENVTTITITAGSLQQVIEGLNLSTGTYTLSWTGTAQGKIGAGAYGASGITGSATGGTNLTVEFGIGTLSKVQFNFGSIALPFQPKRFDEELRACQRYLYAIYSDDTLTQVGVGLAATTTIALIVLPAPVTQAKLPSLVATATDWVLTDGNTSVALASIAIQPSQNGKTGCTLRCTVAAGLTQFRPYILTSVSTGKLLLLNAEL